jgi:hypothetical protein
MSARLHRSTNVAPAARPRHRHTGGRYSWAPPCPAGNYSQSGPGVRLAGAGAVLAASVQSGKPKAAASHTWRADRAVWPMWLPSGDPGVAADRRIHRCRVSSPAQPAELLWSPGWLRCCLILTALSDPPRQSRLRAALNQRSAVAAVRLPGSMTAAGGFTTVQRLAAEHHVSAGTFPPRQRRPAHLPQLD